MSDPSGTPAGWYDDGSGTGTLRYWDGNAWTEHTAPAPSAAQPPSEAAAAASVAASGSTPESAPADEAVAEIVPSIDAGDPLAPVPPIPTEYGTEPPLYGPGSTQATQPYGTEPPLYGPGSTQPTQPYYGAAAPGTAVISDGEEPTSSTRPHVLGLIALAVAAVGFIFACIPFIPVIAWVLLPIAFVLSIVALFMKGAKWPAITGLVVSIVGTIVAALVFFFIVSSTLTDAFDEVEDAIAEASEAAEVPNEASEPAEEPEPGDLGTLSFGETNVWEDGVELSVAEPQPYTPSEFAAGADQASNIVFSITITNNSTENLEPTPFPRVSSGGQEATQIFDVSGEGEDVGIPPTTVILPGQSVTWQSAWSVSDPNTLTMQIAPSFEYEDAIFTNIQ